MNVGLYALTDPIPWPDGPDADFARRWLSIFAGSPTEDLIRNVRTDLRVAVIGDVVLPYTVTDRRPGNSYVCSPHTHYVAYGREELEKLGNPALVWVLDKVVAGLGWWVLRARFDDVVYVNNWLLSTNLYPAMDASHVAALHHALVDRYPDRAIVFRSVEATGNPGVAAALDELGHRRCFSRIVWYQDPSSPAVRRKKSFKIDGQVLRRSGYEVVDAAELPDDAFERLRELYDMLYLGKYSHYNPQFTTELLRSLCREGLLRVRALRRDGRLDGVYGYYERRGIGTAPVFGYDTSLPQDCGLYRMLSRVYADEGRDRGLVLNCSAGVGHFKKHRGSTPAVEYNRVYDRHLPARQRRPWAVLTFLLDRIGVPIIERMEL